MPSRGFDVDTVNLESLFGSWKKALSVPLYQRRFDWQREQVEQLWQDITEAHIRGASDYFLGTIVLVETPPDKLEIIDGQQRLATLAMLLAAIRNVLADNSSPESRRASSKLGDLIIRSDLSGSNTYPVLTLGQEDKEPFYRYVQLTPGDPSHLNLEASTPKAKPGRPRTRIRDAFELFFKFTQAHGQTLSSDAKATQLIKLAEFVITNVTLISIIVDDDADAYMIFESLNARGLDLSVADLLKNHLFGRAQMNELENVSTAWGLFMDALDNYSTSRFLRYYWLSNYQFVTERTLYERIKAHLKEKSVSSYDFVTKLFDSATVFVNLVHPQYSDLVDLDLRDLSAMRVTQGLPFLLAAKELSSQKDFNFAVRIVESLAVRNIIVGGRNPNELERKFSEWAKELRQGSKMTKIAKDARDSLLGDKDFVEDFSQLHVLSTPHARYLLRKIEWHKNKETQMAASGVEIEHVLPQHPDEDWTSVMGGDKDEVLDASTRLGNLTLLDEKLNRKAAARPFVEKRDKYYRKSKIDMTQKLCGYENWTLEKIDERQKGMAEIAKEIWTF
ncbi:MAG: DUF262 domain-containing HNH endonuclease family protein [Chloroflexi bacterium]|nr:DUF262 domain-containing HNH endonuclease family protein [Chloroflexota bacterium]